VTVGLTRGEMSPIERCGRRKLYRQGAASIERPWELGRTAQNVEQEIWV